MKRRNESGIEVVLRKNIGGILSISKLAGDASTREYYRINKKDKTFIAMVYPKIVGDEIDKILKLSVCFKEAGLNVPEIIDRIDENILLLEDLGDLSLQNYLAESGKKGKVKIKNSITEILGKIGKIPIDKTDSEMTRDKMEYEIDFFINNFICRFLPSWDKEEKLRTEILGKIGKISTQRIFAHRDFHSRNIYIKDGRLYLIDFQDSLLAPKYYDSVSFVFDSYICQDSSDLFFSIFNNETKTDMEQVYLTAYQRIIKALGTFGYQYFLGNKKFFQYINPAISNLRKNKYFMESDLLVSLLSEIVKKNGLITCHS